MDTQLNLSGWKEEKKGIKVLKIIKQIPFVAVALTLVGISINMFLGPHHIAAGGVSGIGILVEYVLGINRAITVLFLNMAMLVLACVFLGKEVFFRSVIASLMLPILLGIVPDIMAIQNPLLSMIFGSAIMGVGVSILYNIGASGGGTSIPPLIFKKYFKLNTSIGLLITDATVVFLSIFVFGYQEFLYAVLSLVLISIVMNYIETRMK